MSYKIAKECERSNGKKYYEIFFGDLISNDGIEALFNVETQEEREGGEISFNINKTKFYEPKPFDYGWIEITLPVSTITCDSTITQTKQ